MKSNTNLILLVLAALGVGVVLGFTARGVHLRRTFAEGVLETEAWQREGDSPNFPRGHYVLSRVYVRGAPTNFVGKRVVVSGSLGVLSDDATVTLQLPCIKPDSLGIRIKE